MRPNSRSWLQENQVGKGLLQSSIVRVVISGVFFVAVLPWIGISAAGTLLVSRQEPRQAEVIVVLGGESGSRAGKAVELYRRGFAPKVLVTGKNERERIGRRLVAAGIPESAVFFEPAAESTFENASFSLPILKGWQTQTALLVTSWFHSRRAMATFVATDAAIEFISVPTEPIPWQRVISDTKLLRNVLLEYLKIVGYWIRYGITPSARNEHLL